MAPAVTSHVQALVNRVSHSHTILPRPRFWYPNHSPDPYPAIQLTALKGKDKEENFTASLRAQWSTQHPLRAGSDSWGTGGLLHLWLIWRSVPAPPVRWQSAEASRKCQGVLVCVNTSVLQLSSKAVCEQGWTGFSDL